MGRKPQAICGLRRPSPAQKLGSFGQNQSAIVSPGRWLMGGKPAPCVPGRPAPRAGEPPAIAGSRTIPIWVRSARPLEGDLARKAKFHCSLRLQFVARRLGSFGQNHAIRRASKLPNWERAEGDETLPLHTIRGGRLGISRIWKVSRKSSRTDVKRSRNPVARLRLPRYEIPFPFIRRCTQRNLAPIQTHHVPHTKPEECVKRSADAPSGETRDLERCVGAPLDAPYSAPTAVPQSPNPERHQGLA